jgi:hypothetical protein
MRGIVVEQSPNPSTPQFVPPKWRKLPGFCQENPFAKGLVKEEAYFVGLYWVNSPYGSEEGKGPRKPLERDIHRP